MNLGCPHPLQGESPHQKFDTQCHGRGDNVGITLRLDAMTSDVFSNLNDYVIKGQNLLVLLKATSLIIRRINYAFGL